jgi:hypothetical protein
MDITESLLLNSIKRLLKYKIDKKASWRQEAFLSYKIPPMTIQDINSIIEPQKKGTYYSIPYMQK